jgi:hypothetical protein
VEVSDYPTCARTFATFRIYSGRIDPDEVTARLLIEPSRFQRTGDPLTKSKQAILAKMHGWFLTTDGAIESRDVRTHLDWLLERLVPRAEAVRSLQADGCSMDISCYWLSFSGHGGPSVRPAQMAQFARLGLELWFDVYFGAGEKTERGAAPDPAGM